MPARLVLVLAGALCALAEFRLASTFGNGEELPTDHRGDEDDVSPPLTWSGAPKHTASFVLIVDSEGEGGKQTHWIVYDIPKDVSELREELSGAGSSDVARLGLKVSAASTPSHDRVTCLGLPAAV